MLAIIGGSALANLSGLQNKRLEVVRTPYGEPSSALTCGELDGYPVVFMARHGYGHTIPPHRINYRANLWALREQEVKEVVALATVGAIHPTFLPGHFALPDQLIDYTYGREFTYYEYDGLQVEHLDFTQPYCAMLRAKCAQALTACGEDFMPRGTYATTQGPRLETAAEVERMARDGADMVGMTGMPEAYLARELGLCYAPIAISVNWAAGRGDSEASISMEQMSKTQETAMYRLNRVLQALAAI